MGIIHGIGHIEAFQNIKNLHFADTLLFYAMEEKKSLIVTKTILLGFKNTFGLNMEERELDYLSSFINCNQPSLPISYLSFPFHDIKITKNNVGCL